MMLNVGIVAVLVLGLLFLVLMMGWWLVKSLLGVGSVLGAALAWSRNRSIGFTILGFILGWFYVIYWVLTYQKKTPSQ